MREKAIKKFRETRKHKEQDEGDTVWIKTNYKV